MKLCWNKEKGLAMKTFLKSILTILVFTLTLLPAQDGLIPIHRYFSKADKDHFYTKKADVAKKWKSQGVEFYAFESAGLEKPALVSEEKPAVTTEASLPPS